ncbi:MAG: hypothetical protein ACC653_11800 [Gammaproteobacteria bacterium]
MENSNILYFPVKKTVNCEFDLMHNLLRYVYNSQKNNSVIGEAVATEEKNALQHSYYCRAALKRRLKQVAMHEHELKN